MRCYSEESLLKSYKKVKSSRLFSSLNFSFWRMEKSPCSRITSLPREATKLHETHSHDLFKINNNVLQFFESMTSLRHSNQLFQSFQMLTAKVQYLENGNLESYASQVLFHCLFCRHQRKNWLFYDHLKGVLALSAENNLRRGRFLMLKNN